MMEEIVKGICNGRQQSFEEKVEKKARRIRIPEYHRIPGILEYWNTCNNNRRGRA